MIFLIVYVVGFVVWGFVSSVNYGINKSFGWHYAKTTKKWARVLMATPVWPLALLVVLWLGIQKLYEILKDAYVEADLDKFWERMNKK